MVCFAPLDFFEGICLMAINRDKDIPVMPPFLHSGRQKWRVKLLQRNYKPQYARNLFKSRTGYKMLILPKEAKSSGQEAHGSQPTFSFLSPVFVLYSKKKKRLQAVPFFPHPSLRKIPCILYNCYCALVAVRCLSLSSVFDYFQLLDTIQKKSLC